MTAFGVALPLRRSDSDGFVMIRTIKHLVRQNLKMLVLTTPGERVMLPDYGVGLRAYLFQNFQQDTIAQIDARIRQQVRKYMPAVSIESVSFNTTNQEVNTLSISLNYSIPNINVKDLLNITI
jgi:phage baseplate assembly protein W